MSRAIEKRCRIKMDLFRKQIVEINVNVRNTPQDQVSLEFHIENLKQIASEKKSVFDNLLDVIITQEQLNEIEQFNNDIDKIYRDIYIEVSRRLKEFDNEAPIIIQQKPRAENNIRLPKISIPTFDGNHDEWVYFREGFEKLIVDNEELTDFQRLFYLKSALKDDATKVQSPNDTFRSLWEALIERYANRRTIIERQITALFNVKSVQRESASELRSLLDTFTKHIRVLNTMDVKIDKLSEAMIMHLIMNRLDNETRKLFEMKQDPKELPTWDSMVTFLESRCHALDNIDKSKSPKTENQPVSKSHGRSNVLISNGSLKCLMCKQNHYLNQCEQFLSLTVDKKWENVKEWKACFNCLSTSHNAKSCRRGVCRKCSAMHHTLLHNDYEKTGDGTEIQKSSANLLTSNNETQPDLAGTQTNSTEIQPTTTNALLSNDVDSKTSFIATNYNVLLSTIVLNIHNEYDEPLYCRAILDSGSQSNFVTERLSQLLKLKRSSVNVPIFGIDEKSTVVRHKIRAKILSRTSDYSATLDFLVLPKITGYHPNKTVSPDLVQTPPDIVLADPDFRTPQRVDMLLGIEVFCDVWLKNQIRLGANLPIFCETLFGWIVAGRCAPNSTVDNSFCGMSTNENDLLTEIKKFWEIEHCHTTTMSIEEKEVEIHFKTTHKRQPDGRYVVFLPTKPNISDLGNSKTMAVKRFESLEYKLNKNPEMKQQYHQFIQEYIDLGHMSLTPTTPTSDQTDYFMPHHGVVKPTSSTTKLRVVFDASASSTSGLSLNNVLKVGPTIQPQLFEILLRFRKHRFAFSADVNKMYRQVMIDESQHHLQQILWRFNSTDEIKPYSLKTVTYGTASAPYLATRALTQLAEDERIEFPQAADVVETDFYVDDVLSGAESLEEAQNIQVQLIAMLKRGGFKLHKWCANYPELLTAIPKDDQEKKVIVGESETIKTLGLTWQPDADEFVFSIERMLIQNRPITKRSILSDIARLYDPLGLTGPIIVKAKMMMQNLWQQNLDWDQELCATEKEEWFNYRSQLQNMPDLHIPRCVMPNDESKSIYLLGFCDASNKAYGACIYLHCIDIYGHRKSSLLCSKSKVAPLKVITIPRLELCSAVLLAQLMYKVKQAINLKIDKTIYWSDSTVVLGWINSNSSDAKTFVSHRIAEIQDLSQPSDWRYISTHQNPADIISRGLMPNELRNSTLWWNGPEFLTNEDDSWHNPEFSPERDLPEMKSVALVTTEKPKTEWPFLSFYGKFIHLQRRMAVIMRFVNNCRPRKAERIISPNLTVDDLSIAMTKILQLIQRHEFEVEFKCLKNNRPISSKSPLFRLNVFLDENELIRVGGRIKNSQQCYDVKFQIVLPKRHQVTVSLIRDLHVKHAHVGQRTLLSIVRQRFWPIDAKNTIRRITRSCVKCFRCKPETSTQMMGDLPDYRTVVCHPFFKSGVDYAGPFDLKVNRNTTTKAYVAVFICQTTKAIHLELVSDLTSEAFIAALTRFLSRRGNCKHLYSDNGKNFVGAKNILEPLYEMLLSENTKKLIHEECSSRTVTFHFIPPRAPHFGGLWESAVKQMKYHLTRITNNTKFNFEELLTVLTKIEAILNSRPLFSESDDPEDVNAITPGHFLIGRPLTSLVEPNYTDVKVNRLKRWQLLQQMSQHFWKSWSTDYLTTLQSRAKSIVKTNIALGMLVVIKEDNLPPLVWRLGRIVQLHPGKDDITRVVSIKTNFGIVKRPVVKICILPIHDDDD